MPNQIAVWVDPNNEVRQSIQTSNLCSQRLLLRKMKEKSVGKTNCRNKELVFLACAIKEGRRRRLQMQLALNNLAARRKRFLNLAFLLVLLISRRKITVPRPVRSCRRLKRNTGWWENVFNTYSDARFKKTFRVSRDTFHFILNHIAPFLIRQTVTEEPITPALRLAICL